MLQEGSSFYTNIIGLQTAGYLSAYTMEVESIDLDKIDDNQYDYQVIVSVTNYPQETVTITGEFNCQMIK